MDNPNTLNSTLLASAGADRNGWLTLPEAAKFTPMSYVNFYLRAVKKHELTVVRPGGKGGYYVHRDELARWLTMGDAEPAQ